VQLIEAGDSWRVSGADVSLQGFLRRLMPKGFYGSNRPVEVIDWADVGYLSTDSATVTVQLKSSKDKLSKLHPVEIAQLAEALSPVHRTEIVESLDDDIAADTLEEMSTEAQARILEEMDGERAAGMRQAHFQFGEGIEHAAENQRCRRDRGLVGVADEVAQMVQAHALDAARVHRMQA